MQTINIVFYFPNGMTEDYSFNEWVKSLLSIPQETVFL